jgi:hypothetical protein
VRAPLGMMRSAIETSRILGTPKTSDVRGDFWTRVYLDGTVHRLALRTVVVLREPTPTTSRHLIAMTALGTSRGQETPHAPLLKGMLGRIGVKNDNHASQIDGHSVYETWRLQIILFLTNGSKREANKKYGSGSVFMLWGVFEPVDFPWSGGDGDY